MLKCQPQSERDLSDHAPLGVGKHDALIQIDFALDDIRCDQTACDTHTCFFSGVRGFIVRSFVIDQNPRTAPKMKQELRHNLS